MELQSQKKFFVILVNETADSWDFRWQHISVDIISVSSDGAADIVALVADPILVDEPVVRFLGLKKILHQAEKMQELQSLVHPTSCDQTVVVCQDRKLVLEVHLVEPDVVND